MHSVCMEYQLNNNQPMFLETICIKNGAVQNLETHIFRMEQTATHFGFIVPVLPNLESMLPELLINKKVKCRIEYKETVRNIEFEAYKAKEIQSLRLVEAGDIDYAFKYSDRSELNALNGVKKNCSEILMLKNGFITDTTYSNVVFRKGKEFFTPETYLLNGTKRQLLLQKSIIREIPISIENLRDFEHVFLINSMLDIEDGVGCPIQEILCQS